MSATPGVTKSSVREFATRILKLLISAVYLAVDWSFRQIRRWQGKQDPGTCVVLYYHSVPAAYRERFEEQMSVVSVRSRVIDVLAVSGLPRHQRAVAITFDDALDSFAQNAVPVLVRFNIPANVFVVADYLGTQPVWGESYFSPKERTMSGEALQTLPQNITVGSHSLTHRDLVALSADDAAREVRDSRRRLEVLLGRPVTLFSFPFGAFDDSTVRQCFDAGYERVFTTEPELLSAASDLFVIGRVAADPWDWRVEFRLKIAGAYCWQPRVRALREKIKARFSARSDRGTALCSGIDTTQRPRAL